MELRFAASIGLPLMLGVPSGGDRVVAKDRFIRQRGFRHVGGSFHKSGSRSIGTALRSRQWGPSRPAGSPARPPRRVSPWRGPLGPLP